MATEKEKVDAFEKVLQILDRLIRRGEVYIALDPPFSATFEISRNILLRELEGASLAEEDFQRQSRRIASMLLAVLAEEESDYIASRIRSEELKGEKASKRREVLKEQMSKARERLLTEHLKRRYNLKLSSKAPVFSGIDWDIKIKTVDARLENIRFPYATCRIKFQREFEESPFTLFGGRTFDSMQINFCIDDIDYLIKTLHNIREHLAQTEEHGQGGESGSRKNNS